MSKTPNPNSRFARGMRQDAERNKAINRARDKDGRYLCTESTPWDPTKGTRVVHASAREVGEQVDGYPGGDLVMMKCDDCGHLWEMELPQ